MCANLTPLVGYRPKLALNSNPLEQYKVLARPYAHIWQWGWVWIWVRDLGSLYILSCLCMDYIDSLNRNVV